MWLLNNDDLVEGYVLEMENEWVHDMGCGCKADGRLVKGDWLVGRMDGLGQVLNR